MQVLVQTWQVGAHHAFYCVNKHIKAQIVHMCRTQLGRSHGELSAWCVSHRAHPEIDLLNPRLQFYSKIPVVMVRDVNMVTQLKLMFT